MSQLFGLDSTEEISVSAHKSVGSSVALRYLSHYTPKVIKAGEVARYRAGGIAIVSVFEDYGWTQGHTEDYASGVENARFALAQAEAAGAPKDITIPFAVDTDQYAPSATDAYADGLASILSKDRCGVYGSFDMVLHWMNRGFKGNWQTYAWSQGRFVDGCKVYQYSNDHIVGGVGCDFNHLFPVNGFCLQWDHPAPLPKKWQPDDEAYWCHCWDTQKMSPARHARFVKVMTIRADGIWRLAHEDMQKRHLQRVDWNFRNRGKRFHALWTRLHPTKH